MPSWAETRLACQGILKLARFDADFVRFFDGSRAGALRSFWVSAAIYPYFMLLAWLGLTPDVISETRYFAALTVYYALNCVTLPMILVALAPTLERVDEAIRCITVYNWMGLLGVVIGLPFLALERTGQSPEAQLGLTLLSVIIASIFQWFMLRHALRVGWQVALALTAGDVFLSRFLFLPVLAQAALSA